VVSLVSSSRSSEGTRPSARPQRDAVGLFIAAVHALSRLCGIAAAALIAGAVAVVCQLVFVRYVLNASTVWQTELVVYMMIAATLVGMPYVQLIRGHVNVDLLPLYLGPLGRRGLYLLCLGLGLAVTGIMGVYGAELTWSAYDGNWLSETVWAVPLWRVFIALPIGFLLMFLQYLADLLSMLTGRERPFGIADPGDGDAGPATPGTEG